MCMTKRFHLGSGANRWPFLVSLMGGEIICSAIRNSHKDPSRQSQGYSVWKRAWLSDELCNSQGCLIIFRLPDSLRSSLQLIAQILDRSWTDVELPFRN